MIPWIKMRTNLRDDPRVLLVSKRIKCSTVSVIGGLYVLWSLADQYSVDGRLVGYGPEDLDKTVVITGFAEALASDEVRWLEIDVQSLIVPRFKEHNGESAKSRSQTAKRVRQHRGRNADVTHRALQKAQQRKRKSKRKNETGAKAPVAGADAGDVGEVKKGDAKKAIKPNATKRPTDGTRQPPRQAEDAKPEHGAVRSYFQERWNVLRAASPSDNYPWKHGQDDRHLKWILDQVNRSPAKAKEIIEAYLGDDDPWLADKGHAFGHLVSRFAKYLARRTHNGSDDLILEPTPEQLAAAEGVPFGNVR